MAEPGPIQSSTMNYQVHRSLLGRLEVRFVCPHCGAATINPLVEAGSEQACPSCGGPQVVPGQRELDAEAERVRLARERDHAKAVAVETQQGDRERIIEARAARRLGLRQQKKRAGHADRQGDLFDRMMWRAFRVLRGALAIQLGLAMVVAAIGALMLLAGIGLLVYQATRSSPEYARPIVLIINGLVTAATGYTMYILAAFLGLLVSIERNTRLGSRSVSEEASSPLSFTE